MKKLILNTVFVISWAVMVVSIGVDSTHGLITGFVCATAAGVMARYEERKEL